LRAVKEIIKYLKLLPVQAAGVVGVFYSVKNVDKNSITRYCWPPFFLNGWRYFKFVYKR